MIPVRMAGSPFDQWSTGSDAMKGHPDTTKFEKKSDITALILS